ncbi:hypothetical protein BX600DRAFT_504281 [Xylariales sp. PMI_506]|nr:hypothetical protein BX600DRAFT_504281 [Xylariales sp. PMI_506]
MASAPLTWLITGCSSGFGESIVRHLSSIGENVIATGRNGATKLSHLESTGARILELDVTSPFVELESVAKTAWEIYGKIDVIVNNAGVLLSGTVEELTQEETDLVLKTNLHGSLNVTRAFLPFLRARGCGTLVYMGSESCWKGIPSAATYSVTAVDCLRQELAFVSPNVRILELQPGYFRTQLFNNITWIPSRLPEYAGFNSVMRAHAAELIKGQQIGDPNKLAERLVDLVKGTGLAADKTIPFRLPLGSDIVAVIRQQCEEMLKVCDEWDTFIRSTNY